MNTVTRGHKAGLELALDEMHDMLPGDCESRLNRLIAQASAAPEQEPFAYGLTLNGSPRSVSLVATQWGVLEAHGCKTVPLYTHPSAEIERLRAELATTNKLYEQACKASYEYAETRQKLADAQALLQRTHRDLDACQKVIWLAGVGVRGYGFDPAYCEDAQARLTEIDAFLSATAQPADDMCNHNNPAARCICREEFGHRVCAQPAEVKS